jgi:hypothetical protein
MWNASNYHGPFLGQRFHLKVNLIVGTFCFDVKVEQNVIVIGHLNDDCNVFRAPPALQLLLYRCHDAVAPTVKQIYLLLILCLDYSSWKSFVKLAVPFANWATIDTVRFKDSAKTTMLFHKIAFHIFWLFKNLILFGVENFKGTLQHLSTVNTYPHKPVVSFEQSKKQHLELNAKTLTYGTSAQAQYSSMKM